MALRSVWLEFLLMQDLWASAVLLGIPTVSAHPRLYRLGLRSRSPSPLTSRWLKGKNSSVLHQRELCSLLLIHDRMVAPPSKLLWLLQLLQLVVPSLVSAMRQSAKDRSPSGEKRTLLIQ